MDSSAEEAGVNGARRLSWVMVVFVGGLFSALFSHAIFSALEHANLFGSAYLDHEHSSLPKAAFAAITVACTAALLYVGQAFEAGSRARVISLARGIAGSGPLALPGATALVAVAGLATMEGLEGSVAGSFGSIPLLGMLLVAGVSFAVAYTIRRLAAWIAAATEAVVGALLIIFRDPHELGIHTHRFAASFVLAPAAAARRIHGTRAPPVFLAFIL